MHGNLRKVKVMTAQTIPLANPYRVAVLGVQTIAELVDARCDLVERDGLVTTVALQHIHGRHGDVDAGETLPLPANMTEGVSSPV